MLFICLLSSFSFAGMVDLMILEEMATLHVSDMDIHFPCLVVVWHSSLTFTSYGSGLTPPPPRLEAFDARD